MSSPVFTVIRREYLQRVRNKWFVITTIAFPVLLLGMIFVPAMLVDGDSRQERHIAVVDQSGELFDLVAPRMAEAGYTIDTVPPSTSPQDLNVRIMDGDLGGYLLLQDGAVRTGDARFVAESRPSTLRRFTIEEIVSRSAMEANLARQGVDAASVLVDDGELDVQALGSDDVTDDGPAFVLAFTGTFFLYFTLLFYGVAVLRSVLEEKTGRIVEVIVSSMRPRQLMLGKILGVGAVGLTQLGVWIGSAVLILLLALPSMVAFLPEGVELSDVHEVAPGMGLVVVFATLFLLGYFLYSSLFAAVGAMCSTEEEAQQAQFPVMMLLIIPFALVAPALQSPSEPLWVGLSLFPFFSPILLFARAAAGAAALWEILAAVVLLVLTIWGVAWVAGRIYKVGILMQGKRPTLPELVRWIREA